MNSHRGRYSLLGRRLGAAWRLGFWFVGTTHTALPARARLNRRVVPLSFPGDGGYLYDVINVWLDDEYGLRGLRPQPKTIVDVGANIGLFSLWAWHCCPDATIHAYEPNARIVDTARANLAPTGATVIQAGVASASGRALMHDDSHSRLASTVHAEGGDVRLDGIGEVIGRMGGAVDLLKLDCEGAEWDILLAGDALQAVGRIRMEYHLTDGRTVEELRRLVAHSGFAIEHLAENQGHGIAWLTRMRGLA